MVASLSDWYEQVDAVKGWLLQSEARHLYKLASELEPGSVIVEIGSYHGKSTLALCFGAQVSGAAVYAIDPHEHYVEDMNKDIQFGPADNLKFLENMARAGVGDVLKVVNLSSFQVAKYWQEPIDLLFIDGRHDEQTINHDTRCFGRHVKTDGSMLLHDRLYAPVRKRIGELMGSGWTEQEIVAHTSVLRFR